MQPSPYFITYMKYLIIILLFISSYGYSQSKTPPQGWVVNQNPNYSWQPDKEKHLIAGAIVSGLTYTGVRAVFSNRDPYMPEYALITGSFMGIFVGVVKESFDANGGSGWDTADLAYTALGSVSAAGFAYLVDRTIHNNWGKRRRNKVSKRKFNTGY